MSLLTIGRDVVDNNLKSIRRLPFPDKFWRIPVPFNFPGKTIVLPMPNILVLSVSSTGLKSFAIFSTTART